MKTGKMRETIRIQRVGTHVFQDAVSEREETLLGTLHGNSQRRKTIVTGICSSCQRTFSDKNPVGGRCIVCNKLICSGCAETRCEICNRCVCDNGCSGRLHGYKVCAKESLLRKLVFNLTEE